jgi:hypothetical protein
VLTSADRLDDAKGEGCKRIRIYGRKGGLLLGYEEKKIIMDQELG